MANLAREGRTLDETAALLLKPRNEARDFARDWGIAFPDYVAKRPLVLTWALEERGCWSLKVDGLLLASATANRNGGGAYTARREDIDFETGGSTAEIAMRRMSVELEREAVAIFGVDDVQIWMAGPHRDDLLAPDVTEDPSALRSALATA
ncbi:hypothetical protein SFC76_03075 [Sphingomonas sp. CD22]|uniref:hypothetical protein n=1 Tax=Sphingomonas sp. CD22 TaxID=3100214 RepID=UPI002AE00E72|nr:hypothetical protein [Sphingomonas sp. CD22]MEA1083231.1 hypothetical protein [Sphingomonas sp. CD22]